MSAKLPIIFPRDGHRIAAIGTNLIVKMTTTKWYYRGIIQQAMA